MTELQFETLARVRAANAAGRWYRAGAGCSGCSGLGRPGPAGEHAPRCGSGERVVLANLYRKTWLDRRVWRKGRSTADDAHEYKIRGKDLP